jgi:hypothetical protein
MPKFADTIIALLKQKIYQLKRQEISSMKYRMLLSITPVCILFSLMSC